MDLTVFCQGCLSQDRVLKPVEKLDCIFNIIFHQSLDTFQMVRTPSDILLCWECVKMLKNIERFHHKVLLAQQTLQETVSLNNYGVYIETLSSLSTTLNDVITIKNEEPTSENEKNQTMETKLKSLKEVSISKVPIVVLTRSLWKKTNATPSIQNQSFEYDVTLVDNLKQEDDFDDSYDDNYEPEDITNKVIEEKKTLPQKTISTPAKRKSTVKKTRVMRKRAKTSNRKVSMAVKLKFFILHKNLLSVIPGSQHDIDIERAKSLNVKTKEDSQNSLDISSAHDDKGKDLTCTKCNEECYNEKDFTSHMKLHFRNYTCRFCDDDVTYDEDNIISHMRTEHRHETTLHVCRKCAKIFVCEEELKIHMEECKVFKCNDCDHVFGFKREIGAHCKSLHMKIKCKECNYTLKSWDTYRLHKKRLHSNKDPQSAYCVECNVQFKSEICLREHLRTSVKHLPESKLKRFACSKCPNVYRKKISCTNHYNKVHIGITKYHCETCQKYFLHGPLLRKHHKSVHLKIPNVKTHLCIQCGKSFSDSTTLHNHMTTHSGEKPYRCVYCGKRYNKSGWYYHMSVAHPDSVRDINSARIPEDGTIHDSHPEQAEPVKNYKCHICGKAYRLKRYLRYHHYTHTGEKPYVCQLCGKEFRFNANYYKHLRINHGIFGNKKKQKQPQAGSVT